MIKTTTIVFLVFLQFLGFSQGNIPKQSQDDELGIFERLDSLVDLNLTFTDENGKKVRLGDLITKPTALSLVYYKCPGICTLLMNGVSDAIKQNQMVLATEYNVINLSFDPTEKPALARSKKNGYLRVNKGQDVEHGWYFLTGDSANIAKILHQTGFHIKKTGNQFIHAGALIILSPEGKITRYLNGSYYNPFDLKLSLIEASKGKSSPTINKVLDYCFSYDPQGKKYVFNITKVAGSVVIFFAAILLFSMIMIEVKRKRKNQQSNNQNV
ncbi:MAG: hypothetical protein AUJ98_05955 [Bacteroidetes bacterium CG2_30_33_31]|nr:MAG: hypothetical protein AUJ98_05955 [Bacteroidetes bacterium CG2_30_33_31]